MSLFDKINDDLKSAMKAQEKDKLEAIRAVKTAFLIAKSDKGASSVLSDDEELKIIQKLVKQRKESADIYKSQNRDDLYQKEIFEAEVISAYLPKQMDEGELVTALKEIIARTGAKTPQDMGKVMGVATKELAGKADGKMIASKVKELLGN
ncbi:MAG: GatB/YqeY domain-containing protein [Bacteroidales bacterium]|nr:GatB/YqeY domain-containing protein [Bacteroidales bacterium]